MTRSATAKQADIERAMRVAKNRDTPHAVEIAPDGTIRIIPVVMPVQAPVAPKRPVVL